MMVMILLMLMVEMSDKCVVYWSKQCRCRLVLAILISAE